MFNKQLMRQKRHKRVRAKIQGTKKIPRLCVFRSNKHIYAQLIDDTSGKTIVSASDIKLKGKKKLKGKTQVAHEIGKLIAKNALEKNIEKIIFDRAGYKYHGRIKAIADGARESGLKF